PGLAIINGYGPTENTTFSTFHPIDNCEDASVPIGKPVSNSQAYVLDRHMNLAPAGVAGELYVGGDGLARGYLNRPDATAQSFVPHPFSATGERLYRTGDLARMNESGDLEFLGRIDQQVKIRGFRIEPGEIEAALTQISWIREAAVVVREGVDGDKRLIAYIVADDGCKIDSATLRSLLAEKLPAYMQPSAIISIEGIPLSPNGKLDRAALPDPIIAQSEARLHVAPRNTAEWLLVKEFKEILGVDKIGVTDNFFELGGHSLSAIRLVERIRRLFGRTLAPSELFRTSTVEAIARRISEHQGETASCLVSLNRPTQIPPLYCVHPAGGSVMRYRRLAESLDGIIEVVGVQSRSVLNPAHLDASIEEMAKAYISQIQEQHPADAPYFLLGWSSGGFVAAAIAAELEAMGKRVAFLGLLDSYADIDDDAFESHTALASFQELAALEGFDADSLLTEEHREELVARSHGLSVKDQYRFAATWGEEHGLLKDVTSELVDIIYRDAENTIGLVRRHLLQKITAPIHLWKAEPSPGPSDFDSRWRDIAAGGLIVHHTTANHDSIVADAHVIEEIKTVLACTLESTEHTSLTPRESLESKL
ncbi:MAG: AMP-binding protein, partial [Methylocystis sp.]|nr:AMP-binding protein [Methylocystis sp.]